MTKRPRRSLFRFHRDERGSSAVEFSIIIMPFILVVMMVLQMGIYYMTQSALDTGVARTADYLIKQYYSGSTPVIPTPANLKAMVVTNAAGFVKSGVLKVELRKFSSLTNALVPIVDGTQDPNVANDMMALRAEATVIGFVPGFSALTVVRSSALVRRQSQ